MRKITNKAQPSLFVSIATFGIAGYSPYAPGTVGTLIGLIIYLFVPSKPSAYWLFLLISVPLCTWIIDNALASFSVKDPRQIILDEAVGFWVSMAFLPRKPFFIIAAFALFRFFDITKIFPIKHAENFKGGLGIVLDDILAGVYANIILHILFMATQPF